MNINKEALRVAKIIYKYPEENTLDIQDEHASFNRVLNYKDVEWNRENLNLALDFLINCCNAKECYEYTNVEG